MPKGFPWLCLVSFLSTFLASPVSVDAKAEEKKTEKNISLDVTEASIEDVLKLLSQQAGINFVASEEVKGKTVTTYLDQVPTEIAIQSILEANRLAAKPVQGSSTLFLVTESLAPKVETITKVIRLKHARIISSPGELNSVLTLGSSPSSSFSAGGTGGAAPAGAPPGGFGGEAAGTPGGSAGGGGIVNIVRSLLSQYGSLTTDSRVNALIITDVPERFSKIEKTISELDIPQPQVFIQAEILEVSLNTLRRIGLELGTDAGQIASYEGPKRETFFPFSRNRLFEGKTPASTFGTISMADADVVLKLLATESDVKFLARPKLMTLSNETATIQIVSNAATSSVSTSQATTGTVTTSFERTVIGTTLRVTPVVHGDKYITMLIQPEVSRVVESTKFSTALDPSSRSAATTVTVENGQMVMIAGLISRDFEESTRKVPFLGDIPLLGAPFRRVAVEDKNTEIIVFITPRIVTEDEELEVLRALTREQSPLSSREERKWGTSHRRELRRRAMDHTIRIFSK